ncbi:MAG: winged helix-turn-helix domain-containing protein [Suipraeoptans sp.]
MTLNRDELSATYLSEEIPLTVREFEIMFKMLSAPKRIFTRSQLMDDYWGLENQTGLRSVDVYINKLREKFAICEEIEIQTVRGLGYKVIEKGQADSNDDKIN